MKSEDKDISKYTLNDLCELKLQIEDELITSMCRVLEKYDIPDTFIKVEAEWRPPQYVESGLTLDVKFEPYIHEEFLPKDLFYFNNNNR